jgi:hypothetical protein
MNLPRGAQRIVESRMRGEKPGDLVIVSLVGPLADGNPVVLADGPEYDWRFCRSLKVCIFGKVGTPNRQTAIAIGASLPEKLWLWDVEARVGTDVIVHLRESGLTKPAAQIRVSDWSAILDPWTDWQNKQFEEVRL